MEDTSLAHLLALDSNMLQAVFSLEKLYRKDIEPVVI